MGGEGSLSPLLEAWRLEMNSLVHCPSLVLAPRIPVPRRRVFHNSGTRFQCSQQRLTQSVVDGPKTEYKPGLLDDLFMAFFRSKMVEEVGWDSQRPGYDGLIEVANKLLMKGKGNLETEKAAVRVLRSLFPPFLLELYQLLITPIAEGKFAAMMLARATALSCQWLMGPCTVNSIDLPDGSTCTSGVYVERCKYLEESKCVGICINTCKLPTQTFFKDHMGVPLYMEPNFKDYSCQFKFGVAPSAPADDKLLQEPCLDMCPNASRRKQRSQSAETQVCPKV